MWNNKLKALSFTFDDGLYDDIRLVELFNRYNLKATFNINSGLFDAPNHLSASEIVSLYKGHEIAGHTLTHPRLTELDDNTVLKEINGDIINLEKLAGCEIAGFAYPCGGVNTDERVINLIKTKTKIKYARSNQMCHCFDLPENMYLLKASVHTWDFDRMEQMGDDFIKLKTDKPQVFNIMGHSSEFNTLKAWDRFEKLLEKLSGKNDIYYATNKEIYLV